MLDFLKGEVVEIQDDFCVVESHEIGYVVNMASNELALLTYNHEKIFLRLIVREDSLTLYGFLSKDSRTLFDLLTSVSSIGPKVAMGILSTISLSSIVYAITSDEAEILTSAPGVGKKTAQRIVLELKDKITKYNFKVELEQIEPVKTSAEDGVIEALVSLGYNNYEAKLALNGVNEDLNIEEKIKYALRNLSK